MMQKVLSLAFPLVALCASPAQGASRPFDPVKDVGISLHQGVLTVTLPPGVHLKQRFFKVELATRPGTLAVGPLPPPDGRDGAGDPVWHGALHVPLSGAGLKDPVILRITYQPCTEGEGSVCYLPQHRLVEVSAGGIPVAAR